MLNDILFKNWKTSLLGFVVVGGLFIYNNPDIVGGEESFIYKIVKLIKEEETVSSLSFGALCFLAKDADVTGNTTLDRLKKGKALDLKNESLIGIRKRRLQKELDQDKDTNEEL
jgi:hypothetical protein